MKHLTFMFLWIGAIVCNSAIAEDKKADITPTRTLESRVRLLEARLSSLEARVPSKFASLDCISGKYDEFMLQSNNLVFFASCKKIEPYLEGYKVTIQVGNPHAFNFSNVKGELGHGEDLFNAFSNKSEITTSEIIRAGTWQELTVIVNPSTAKQMRSLILELSAERAGAIQ